MSSTLVIGGMNSKLLVTQGFGNTAGPAPTLLSAHAQRVLRLALADPPAAAELVTAINTGVTELSAQCQRILRSALADPDAAAEISSAVAAGATVSAYTARILRSALADPDAAAEIVAAINYWAPPPIPPP